MIICTTLPAINPFNLIRFPFQWTLLYRCPINIMIVVPVLTRSMENMVCGVQYFRWNLLRVALIWGNVFFLLWTDLISMNTFLHPIISWGMSLFIHNINDVSVPNTCSYREYSDKFGNTSKKVFVVRDGGLTISMANGSQTIQYLRVCPTVVKRW